MLGVLVLVVIVALTTKSGAPSISISSRMQTATASARREQAKQCLQKFQHKLFADGAVHEESRTVSFILNTADMISSDAQIFLGADRIPMNDPTKWSTTVTDRMNRLTAGLFEKHKQFPSTPRGVAIALKQDIVTVDPTSCALTAVYLGDPRTGAYHRAVESDLIEAKSDALVRCMFCNEHHDGTRPAVNTVDNIWIIASSPLTRITISTCNTQTTFFTSLKLYRATLFGTPTFVSNSKYCGGWFSRGRTMTFENVLTTSSSPFALSRAYDARVGTRFPIGSGGNYRLTVECECANLRRDWADIGTSERSVYSGGLRTLRDNGKYAIFTSAHANGPNNAQGHGNSAFLTWHRYYIWEMERQIRELGGRFSCFSLSYWDWTRYNTNPRNDPMWSSVIGGDGTSSSDRCVASGQFTRPLNYTTPNLCSTSWGDTASDVSAQTCCLKRDFDNDVLATAQTAVNYVLSSTTFTSFRPSIEGSGMHNWAHCFINGHMCNVYFSPDDPAFFLVHTFIDYLWAMWQDCHEYDKVASSAITSTIYQGVSPSDDDGVDDYLRLNVLDAQPWAVANIMQLKNRDMHSIQDGIFEYTYEESDLFSRSGLNTNVCVFNWIQTMNAKNVMNVAEDASVLNPVSVATLSKAPRVDRLAARVNQNTKARRVSLERKHPEFTIKELNTELARAACIESRNLAVRYGYAQRCVFDRNYEKCGGCEKDPPLKISLDELLSKKGVAGNECLMRIRRRFYSWARQANELRGLCNGEFDPLC